MFEQDYKKQQRLKAYLVGILRNRQTMEEARDHLDELTELVQTMGAEIVGLEVANAKKPNPTYLVGSGTVESIKENAVANEASLIIVDDELSPAQQRNWEKATELAVIDRREVILDIFAQRAQTREARLQVELAQLEYSLPRLRRAWTHLERQRGGGSFTGGAGEAQIEVDRRIVKIKISRNKEELAAVRLQRATQRKARIGRPVPSAALVGYTNSGKSTLMNALTGAHVLAEDKLFATLDPTTRKLDLGDSRTLLLTDTVGFIRKLPTTLVEAFKATLEETLVADFLLHVIDVSHPNALEHLEATRTVLAELNAQDKPVLYVLNKVDRGADPLALAELRRQAEPAVLTSAITGDGIRELRARMMQMAYSGEEDLELVVPNNRHDLISLVHREGRMLDARYEDDGVHIHAQLPSGWATMLRRELGIIGADGESP